MSHAFREKFKRYYKCIGVEVVHAWDGSERVGAFSISRYDGIYLVRWSAPISCPPAPAEKPVPGQRPPKIQTEKERFF